ncbi:hypothetical protein OPQ81_007658 [Rhizoctonia solani]|nr:hypothetical protein OPQ81_007658 [Rhizoctonia solani]
MGRLSKKPVTRGNAGSISAPLLQLPIDLMVLQTLLRPDHHRDPDTAPDPESQQEPSDHFFAPLVPNPVNTITSDVQYAMNQAFSTDSSPVITVSKEPSIITSQMTIPEVLKIHEAHHCPNVTSDLSPLEANPPTPWAGGRFGDVYKWTKKDGSAISVKCLRIYASSDSKQKNTKRASHELYNWFKARHRNVLELSGIAVFNGRLAMVSPWMENGNIRKYVESHPDVDRWGLCIQVAEGLAHIHGINMVCYAKPTYPPSNRSNLKIS